MEQLFAFPVKQTISLKFGARMVEHGELCVHRSIEVQVVKTLKRVIQQMCFPFPPVLFSFQSGRFNSQ